MREMKLRQAGFTQRVYRAFNKTKNEYKNLKKPEIHNISIKTNQIKLVLNMAWLMEILNI